jgi:hypothetical protein
VQVWPVRLPSAFDFSSRRWWVLAGAVLGKGALTDRSRGYRVEAINVKNEARLPRRDSLSVIFAP